MLSGFKSLLLNGIDLNPVHLNKILHAAAVHTAFWGRLSFPALERKLCAAKFLKDFSDPETDCCRPQFTLWISNHKFVLS